MSEERQDGQDGQDEEGMVQMKTEKQTREELIGKVDSLLQQLYASKAGEYHARMPLEELRNLLLSLQDEVQRRRRLQYARSERAHKYRCAQDFSAASNELRKGTNQ